MTPPLRLVTASQRFLRSALLLLSLISLPLSAAINTGLVAYWQFEDNLNDETATNAHGTFNGANIDYDPGKFSRCIELDGNGEYIEIDSVPANTFDFGTGSGGSGNVTVSAWFITTPWDNTNWQALVAKGEGNNWRIARRSGNDEISYAGGGGDIYAAGLNSNDQVWHHVLAISEAGVNTRIWVDGALASTSGGSGTLGNQNGKFMMIGNNPDSTGRTWKGKIDEVAIWDRVLTTAEIGQIWNGGTGATIESLSVPDTDGDGLSDTEETTLGADGYITNPNVADTDGDGVNDGDEFNAGSNPTIDDDSDGDGINNLAETTGSQNPYTGSTLGTAPGDTTDPLDNDSDNDTILDGEEVVAGTDTYVTNPNDANTDGDALDDAAEITAGYDPTNAADPGNIWDLNLVAYWPMDGDLLDATGTGHNGTNLGTATSSFTPGKFAQGIDLDGIDQRIQIGGSENDFDFPGGSISISAWFRVDAFTTSWQSIASKGEGNTWRAARQGNSDSMAYYPGSDGDLQNTSITVNDGGFHHIVGITNGSGTGQLWVDGVLAAESAGAPVMQDSVNAVLIGGNPDVAGFRVWNGLIDDVAIWSRPLSASEVTELWNGGTGNPLSDLLVSDSDMDGMDDDWETLHFGDLSHDGTTSSDADTLTDLEEYQHGTDPNNPDTDGDRSDDDVEIVNKTDPNNPDTDGDGLPDGIEATEGTNPLLADTDGDGLSDGEEVNTLGTDPTLADSDLDGLKDGIEILLGFNPLLNTSTPPAGSEVVGVTTPGSVDPYLNTLPLNTPGALAGTNWQTEDYFTAQGNFSDLKGVASEPNSSFIAVIERRGTIQRVDAGDRNTTGRQQTLDIQTLTENGDNGGLRSVVFHPNYNLSGQVGEHYMYCFYSTEARSDISGFTAPYLTYSNTSDDYFFYRLSRFTRNPGTGNFDLGTEQVMIQQMTRDRGQHFGGGLTFGNDGFLHISWGDTEFNSGRVGVPFYQDNQRIDRIFQAAVLRIDVDQIGGATSHAPTRTLQGNTGPNAMAGTTQSCDATHNYYHHDNHSGVGYNIPSDNFWVLNPPGAGSAETSPAYPAHGDALEEHQAIGFRNPWRMTTDPVSGDIAVFIVGSNANPKTEEVDVLQPGGNFGWAYREGDHLKAAETNRTVPTGGESYAPIFLGTEIDPVAFWEHSSGNGSVATGGLYYRGTQWPSVAGKLIAADHSTGKIWSIDYLGAGAASGTNATTGGVQHPDNFTVNQMFDSSLNIRQMCASPDGQEILIAANSNIHRLYDNSTPTGDPPALLSATGAFTNTTNLTPRTGMIAYEPEAPLWSDRAKKPRWMAVPNSAGTPGEYDLANEKITFSESGEWAFPEGSVFVKQFTLPLDERDPDNPALQKRLETRFAVHGDDGVYYFFTYKWNATDTDADLLPIGDTSAFSENYTVTDLDGNTYSQTWDFPTRAQCVDCHQLGANDILGVKTRQLSNMFTYPSTGTNGHQMGTLNKLNIFDQTLDIPSMAAYLKSRNISDTTASLEQRVHSYLDSNCSHCHRPGSDAGLSSFDARLTTPMSLTGIIDADPNAGLLGISGAKIVKPRDIAKSILWHRDASINDLVGPPVIDYAMPPLAKLVVDDAYITVLTDWINRIGLPEFDTWAQNLEMPGGPNDDFDLDGLSNGLEFLLKLDGSTPNADAGLNVATSGTNTTVSFPVSGDALSDGFFPMVEDSTDLMMWHAAGGQNSILTQQSDTSSPGIDGIMSWQFTDSDYGYARVKLGSPAP